MGRKWCEKRLDYYRNRGRDLPKYSSTYCEVSPEHCLTQHCCDPERLWCLRSNCSILECNKTKWGNRRRKIDKKVEKLEKVGREFEQLLENAQENGVDFRNNKDIKTFEFYENLFYIMDQWHPLINGDGEIKLYYKVLNERGD